MTNWRDDLKRVIEEQMDTPPERSHASVEKARRDISRFISRTAMPAFEALKEELEQYDRQCSIERRDYQVTLSVFHQDKEEFSYSLKGQAFHRVFLAFSEFGDPGKDSQLGRAEILLNTDGTHGRSLQEIDRETIIRDFIAEYARWLGKRSD